MNLKNIIEREGFPYSKQGFSNIINGHRRPSWKKAKKLSEVFSNTTPELWLDGSPEEIRSKIQASI